MPQGHSPLSALISTWEAAPAPAWSRSGALGTSRGSRTAVCLVLLRVLGGPSPPTSTRAGWPWLPGKGPLGLRGPALSHILIKPLDYSPVCWLSIRGTAPTGSWAHSALSVAASRTERPGTPGRLPGAPLTARQAAPRSFSRVGRGPRITFSEAPRQPLRTEAASYSRAPSRRQPWASTALPCGGQLQSWLARADGVDP